MRLEENKLTSVKGNLTLHPESVQQVDMKDGFLVFMLDCCTVSDDAGMCRLTLLGSAIEEVVNNNSYSIADVRIKIFNSITYLTPTPGTMFSITEESYLK